MVIRGGKYCALQRPVVLFSKVTQGLEKVVETDKALGVKLFSLVKMKADSK